MAQGGGVAGEARRAAPRSVPRRERGRRKRAQAAAAALGATRATGRPGAGESPAHTPQVAPGVTCGLRYSRPPLRLATPPPQVETGLDDSFGRGQGAGRGGAAPGRRFGARYASGSLWTPGLRVSRGSRAPVSLPGSTFGGTNRAGRLERWPAGRVAPASMFFRRMP